ncbi:hypothetical protein NUU61_001976 [Penicillium alfredii]|uniref:Cytochrome P450 n=1 Tax=Penicillium alfredii TaxID=1506179 RepID=A0A9W9FQV5_9EURO|nr:uncharacterized protein NUU61_001976 [Penicillium alfredii]KAJ5104629.1 hypothetical protein NUU61_001976 [Penicillium alfredii]
MPSCATFHHLLVSFPSSVHRIPGTWKPVFLPPSAPHLFSAAGPNPPPMNYQMVDSIALSLVGAFFVAFLLLQRSGDTNIKRIPTLKYYAWTPAIFNRLLYYPKAACLIYRGYEKYKDTPFRMLTADGALTVLPVKYLDELRNLPPSVISSLDAQYEQNALGDYTNILVNSGLPSATVRKRLTPGLGRIVPWVIDELRYAFDSAIPECEDDWIKVKPHEMFVQLIARATSRVVAGDTLRRNEEWLNTASQYSVNVGITIFLLRPCPTFFRPLVAPFLPSVRQMKQQLRFVKSLFIPMIRERRAAEQAADPAYVKPDDFLQWMMDMAEEGQDQDPELLAHHMLLLMSLAVVHTSSMALCHALYDLILMPEYLDPLREEIRRTLSDGWENATQTSLVAQRRLDSFLRESQRFNPPGELSFHRMIKEPLALSDGLVLPKGTHICFAAGPMSKDASFIRNPDKFDGFRWCPDASDRNALTSPSATIHDSTSENERPHLTKTPATPTPTASSFVSISPVSMHFGFGRQACPGRFFASNTLKAILSRIISEYDFKLEEDQAGKRPANLVVGEHIIPDMSASVLLRKRSIERTIGVA